MKPNRPSNKLTLSAYEKLRRKGEQMDRGDYPAGGWAARKNELGYHYNPDGTPKVTPRADEQLKQAAKKVLRITRDPWNKPPRNVR